MPAKWGNARAQCGFQLTLSRIVDVLDAGAIQALGGKNKAPTVSDRGFW
jgi:hypothetical protein